MAERQGRGIKMENTNRGLYRESFEHDNCGIGAVVNIKGQKSHRTVEKALERTQKARRVTAWESCFRSPIGSFPRSAEKPESRSAENGNMESECFSFPRRN